MYQLNEEVIAALPEYFASAQIVKERDVKLFSGTRSYLFIQFKSLPEIKVTEETVGPVIDILLDGDKSLSELYQRYNPVSVKVTAGLRWVANLDNQSIRIVGLALTIASTAHHDLQHENLIQPLIDFKLIQSELSERIFAEIKQALCVSQQSITFLPRFFSSHQTKNTAYHQLTEKGKKYIQNVVSPVKQSTTRVYSGENSINPAFENLAQVKYRLHLNEKRIWLLRSDFIIALGIKNAYQELWGYHGLHDAFDEENHRYLDWNDRVGHPSLVVADVANHYDGGVYYAGHIAQRNGYLEVVDNSGRFDRSDLTEEQLEKMEAWLALQFQKAFGEQKVIFIPHPRRNTYDADYYELSLFYTDQRLAEKNVKKREYSAENIGCILNDDKEHSLLTSSV